MPIYAFRCQSCGHEFDRLIAWERVHEVRCSQCDSHEIQRLIAASSFSLKGGGWAKDGYESSNQSVADDTL